VGKKKSLGISKLEIILLIPAIRKYIYRCLDKKTGTLHIGAALQATGDLVRKIGKKANKEYRNIFSSQAEALITLGVALNTLTAKGESKMAKIELGITPRELLSELPGLVAEIFAHYNDDQKISVDEGILIVASLFEALESASDPVEIKAFFGAQAAALRALAPLFDPPEEATE